MNMSWRDCSDPQHKQAWFRGEQITEGKVGLVLKEKRYDG